jgi:hypothetical protein
MDTGVKNYQVDKHKQLIPLNGNAAGVTCFFEVKSKDKKPFNIAVVEQGEMKPKQYKTVEDGYINGQIESADKTYFLVLKAPETCECEVRIVIKQSEQLPQSSSETIGKSSINQNLGENMVIQHPESYFKFKYIALISIIVIIIYLIYKYRNTIKKTFKTEELITSSFN